MGKITDFLNKNLDEPSQNKLKSVLKKNQKRKIGIIEQIVEQIFLFLLAPFNCVFLGLLLTISIGFIIYPNNKITANLIGIGLYMFLFFILYPILTFIAEKLDNKFFHLKEEVEDSDDIETLIKNVDILKSIKDLKRK